MAGGDAASGPTFVGASATPSVDSKPAAQETIVSSSSASSPLQKPEKKVMFDFASFAKYINGGAPTLGVGRQGDQEGNGQSLTDGGGDVKGSVRPFDIAGVGVPLSTVPHSSSTSLTSASSPHQPPTTASSSTPSWKGYQTAKGEVDGPMSTTSPPLADDNHQLDRWLREMINGFSLQDNSTEIDNERHSSSHRHHHRHKGHEKGPSSQHQLGKTSVDGSDEPLLVRFSVDFLSALLSSNNVAKHVLLNHLNKCRSVKSGLSPLNNGSERQGHNVSEGDNIRGPNNDKRPPSATSSSYIQGSELTTAEIALHCVLALSLAMHCEDVLAHRRAVALHKKSLVCGSDGFVLIESCGVKIALPTRADGRDDGIENSDWDGTLPVLPPGSATDKQTHIEMPFSSLADFASVGECVGIIYGAFKGSLNSHLLSTLYRLALKHPSRPIAKYMATTGVITAPAVGPGGSTSSAAVDEILPATKFPLMFDPHSSMAFSLQVRVVAALLAEESCRQAWMDPSVWTLSPTIQETTHHAPAAVSSSSRGGTDPNLSPIRLGDEVLFAPTPSSASSLLSTDSTSSADGQNPPSTFTVPTQPLPEQPSVGAQTIANTLHHFLLAGIADDLPFSVTHCRLLVPPHTLSRKQETVVLERTRTTSAHTLSTAMLVQQLDVSTSEIVLYNRALQKEVSALKRMTRQQPGEDINSPLSPSPVTAYKYGMPTSFRDYLRNSPISSQRLSTGMDKVFSNPFFPTHSRSSGETPDKASSPPHHQQTMVSKHRNAKPVGAFAFATDNGDVGTTGTRTPERMMPYLQTFMSHAHILHCISKMWVLRGISKQQVSHHNRQTEAAKFWVKELADAPSQTKSSSTRTEIAEDSRSTGESIKGDGTTVRRVIVVSTTVSLLHKATFNSIASHYAALLQLNKTLENAHVELNNMYRAQKQCEAATAVVKPAASIGNHEEVTAPISPPVVLVTKRGSPMEGMLLFRKLSDAVLEVIRSIPQVALQGRQLSALQEIEEAEAAAIPVCATRDAVASGPEVLNCTSPSSELLFMQSPFLTPKRTPGGDEPSMPQTCGSEAVKSAMAVVDGVNWAFLLLALTRNPFIHMGLLKRVSPQFTLMTHFTNVLIHEATAAHEKLALEMIRDDDDGKTEPIPAFVDGREGDGGSGLLSTPRRFSPDDWLRHPFSPKAYLPTTPVSAAVSSRITPISTLAGLLARPDVNISPPPMLFRSIGSLLMSAAGPTLLRATDRSFSSPISSSRPQRAACVLWQLTLTSPLRGLASSAAPDWFRRLLHGVSTLHARALEDSIVAAAKSQTAGPNDGNSGGNANSSWRVALNPTSPLSLVSTLGALSTKLISTAATNQCDQPAAASSLSLSPIPFVTSASSVDIGCNSPSTTIVPPSLLPLAHVIHAIHIPVNSNALQWQIPLRCMHLCDHFTESVVANFRSGLDVEHYLFCHAPPALGTPPIITPSPPSAFSSNVWVPFTSPSEVGSSSSRGSSTTRSMYDILSELVYTLEINAETFQCVNAADVFSSAAIADDNLSERLAFEHAPATLAALLYLAAHLSPESLAEELGPHLPKVTVVNASGEKVIAVGSVKPLPRALERRLIGIHRSLIKLFSSEVIAWRPPTDSATTANPGANRPPQNLFEDDSAEADVSRRGDRAHDGGPPVVSQREGSSNSVFAEVFEEARQQVESVAVRCKSELGAPSDDDIQITPPSQPSVAGAIEDELLMAPSGTHAPMSAPKCGVFTAMMLHVGAAASQHGLNGCGAQISRFVNSVVSSEPVGGGRISFLCDTSQTGVYIDSVPSTVVAQMWRRAVACLTEVPSATLSAKPNPPQSAVGVDGAGGIWRRILEVGFVSSQGPVVPTTASRNSSGRPHRQHVRPEELLIGRHSRWGKLLQHFSPHQPSPPSDGDDTDATRAVVAAGALGELRVLRLVPRILNPSAGALNLLCSHTHEETTTSPIPAKIVTGDELLARTRLQALYMAHLPLNPPSTTQSNTAATTSAPEPHFPHRPLTVDEALQALATVEAKLNAATEIIAAALYLDSRIKTQGRGSHATSRHRRQQ